MLLAELQDMPMEITHLELAAQASREALYASKTAGASDDMGIHLVVPLVPLVLQQLSIQDLLQESHPSALERQHVDRDRPHTSR